MKNTNLSFNQTLNLLVKTLNNLGIKTNITAENSIEIIYNEEQKEEILNMLSQIDTDKNGFEFIKTKNKGQTINTINVTFYRNINVTCELLMYYINSSIGTYNINTLNKIDLALDTFSYEDTTISIKKNIDTNNGYLVTITKEISKEEAEEKNHIISNDEILNSKLIHIIVQQKENGNCIISNTIFFKNEKDLSDLLCVKKENTKNLVRKKKNVTLV